MPLPSASPGSFLLLAAGIAAAASSVIFIKLSRLEPVLLCAVRLAVAVAVLAPLCVRDLRRQAPGQRTQVWLRTLVPGAVLGAHFISWVIGARLTPAVHATLIVNMVPAVTPFLLLVLAREPVSRREALGTLVALSGVGLLGVSDLRARAEFVIGDAVCFGSMILFAVYLVLARRNRDVPSLWLYVVPLYAWAALFCLGTSLALEDPSSAPVSLREVALALGLGLVPTVIGHSILNHSMQRVRGQVVAVAITSQPLFAGAMAYAWLGEVPSPASLVAAAGVGVGVILAVSGGATGSGSPTTRSEASTPTRRDGRPS